MDLRSAVSKINKAGILLVFPIQNRKDPRSLWAEFFPRSKMLWEWDENGDNRVAKLWRLRESLSISNQVIYTKWYRGRATFFSRTVFASLLKLLNPNGRTGLSATAEQILSTLEEDSPLSTKALKRQTELQGKLNEGLYNKSMRELWSRFLIVAYGEVDEGAFPSLAVGATRLIFEDLWAESEQLSLEDCQKNLDHFLPPGSTWRKYYKLVLLRVV